MTGLVRCSTCDGLFVEEEFDSHRCDVRTERYEDAEVFRLIESKDRLGRRVIIAKGRNGTDYTLREIDTSRRTPIPFSPTGTGQPTKPTEDGTQ